LKLIIDFILITGFLLNVIVLIGLIRINNKQKPHKLLGLFWCVILVTLIHFYAKLHDLDSLYTVTFLFANGVRLFLAPLIYIYILSICKPDKFSFKKTLKHFTFFAIYLVVYIIPSIVNHLKGQEVFTHLNLITNDYTQGLFQDTISILYLYFSIRLFINTKQNIKKQYSNINQKDFFWVRNFVLCFSVAIVLDILMIALSVLFNLNAAELGYATVLALVTAMFYLGYYGLTQSTIFLPDFMTNERKFQNSNMATDLHHLKEKFEQVIRTEKPYLTQALTLRTLANIANIPERKLSIIINDEMQTTFYDLINKYRIEKAKKKLTSNEFDKYSITGIAETCGFNSKSSFYRIFKKETGLTPTQYKNNNK